MGFNEKKFRRLRKFRFFGRAKVYLLVRWPHLVRFSFPYNPSAFINKLIQQFATQLCQYISLLSPLRS
jgi:O-antigen/teichoic acid export membrane protein